MKPKKVLLFLILFIAFGTSVKAEKVTGFKTYLQNADDVMTYSNEKQGIEKSSRMTVMEWKGNKYYCTSPGIEAATSSETADCTARVMDDKEAAPYLSIYNSGQSQEEQAYATRIYSVNDYMKSFSSVGMQSNGCAYMKMAAQEKVPMNSSTKSYIKQNCTDVDVEIGDDGDMSDIIKQAKKAENDAKNKASNAANPFSVKQSGDTFIYKNGKGVSVSLDCEFCKFKGIADKEFTLTKDNGTLIVEYTPSTVPGIVCDEEDFYTVYFDAEPDDSDGSDTDGGEEEGDEKKKNLCDEVTEITCTIGGTNMQSFKGCSHRSTSSEKGDGKETPGGSEDGKETPGGGGDGSNTFTGSIKCDEDDDCDKVDCPEPEVFFDYPQEADGDGDIDHLCDYTGYNQEITMINEASYYLDNPDFIECCVLRGEKAEKNKLKETTKSEYCSPVHCTEDYKFNSGEAPTSPFYVSKEDHPDAENRDFIAAGSYFRIGTSDGSVKLKDSAVYVCYSENNYGSLYTKVADAVDANSQQDKVQNTKCGEQIPKSQVYEWNCMYKGKEYSNGNLENKPDTSVPRRKIVIKSEYNNPPGQKLVYSGSTLVYDSAKNSSSSSYNWDVGSCKDVADYYVPKSNKSEARYNHTEYDYRCPDGYSGHTTSYPSSSDCYYHGKDEPYVCLSCSGYGSVDLTCGTSSSSCKQACQDFVGEEGTNCTHYTGGGINRTPIKTGSTDYYDDITYGHVAGNMSSSSPDETENKYWTKSYEYVVRKYDLETTISDPKKVNIVYKDNTSTETVKESDGKTKIFKKESDCDSAKVKTLKSGKDVSGNKDHMSNSYWDRKNHFDSDLQNIMNSYYQECLGIPAYSPTATSTSADYGITQKMRGNIDICTRNVTFYYEDGEKLGIMGAEGLELTPDKGTSNTSYNCDPRDPDRKNCNNGQTNYYCEGGKTCDDPAITAHIHVDGINKDIPYIMSSYSGAEIEMENEYTISGITICNDYELADRTFNIDPNASCQPNETKNIGWPVAYDTTYGEYDYKFTVNDVDFCLKDGPTGSKKSPNIKCAYDVNGCDRCEFYGDPTGDCEDCLISCIGIGCIYNEGHGLSVNYQPISLLNIDAAFAFMNERFDGVQLLSNVRNNLINEQGSAKVVPLADAKSIDSKNWETKKGLATINKIDTNGESIYGDEPEYRIVLSASDINEIKKDNQKNGNGGFISTKNSAGESSLTCTKTTISEGIQYVTCRSRYLDSLRASGKLVGKFKDGPEFTNAMSTNAGDPSLTSSELGRQYNTGPAWK